MSLGQDLAILKQLTLFPLTGRLLGTDWGSADGSSTPYSRVLLWLGQLCATLSVPCTPLPCALPLLCHHALHLLWPPHPCSLTVHSTHPTQTCKCQPPEGHQTCTRWASAALYSDSQSTSRNLSWGDPNFYPEGWESSLKLYWQNKQFYLNDIYLNGLGGGVLKTPPKILSMAFKAQNTGSDW